MGRAVEMVIEFTGLRATPAARVIDAHVLHGSPGALTFDPVPEGTRMRWSWDVEPRGMLKLLSPLVARMGRRQEQTIWTGLKDLLEGQGN